MAAPAGAAKMDPLDGVSTASAAAGAAVKMLCCSLRSVSLERVIYL
jgi:hypothetical protein